MDDAAIRAQEDRALRGAAIGFGVTAVVAAGIIWGAIETGVGALTLLALFVLVIGGGVFFSARMRIAFARYERLRAARRATEGTAKTG